VNYDSPSSHGEDQAMVKEPLLCCPSISSSGLMLPIANQKA